MIKIKQIFCKHEYETEEPYLFTNSLGVTYCIQGFKCMRCGHTVCSAPQDFNKEIEKTWAAMNKLANGFSETADKFVNKFER